MHRDKGVARELDVLVRTGKREPFTITGNARRERACDTLVDVGRVEAIGVDGQPPESQWPYGHDRDESDATYEPPHEAVGPFSKAIVRRCPIHADQIERELLNGNCPVVGLRVTDPS